MAIKNVTATRMTMLKLKQQSVVASRGHKLLKDKQDGLMQEFLKIVHGNSMTKYKMSILI